MKLFFIYFALMFAGMITHLMLSLSLYYRQTPTLSYKETIIKYLNPGVTFALIANFIIQTVSCIFLTVPGGDWFIKLIAGGQIPTDLPIGFYVSAFALAFIGQYIAVILGKMVKPDVINQPELKS